MTDRGPHAGAHVPKEKLADFCWRWKVGELSLFGSVLRDDFRPESDIDVLVTFAPDAAWRFYDLNDMREELVCPPCEYGEPLHIPHALR